MTTAAIPPGIVGEGSMLKIQFQATRQIRPADYGRSDENWLTGIGLCQLSLE